MITTDKIFHKVGYSTVSVGAQKNILAAIMNNDTYWDIDYELFGNWVLSICCGTLQAIVLLKLECQEFKN